MIRVRDVYRVMPEMFEDFADQVVNCFDIDDPGYPSDFDILATWDRDAPASDHPTIILCTEPNAHHAHKEFGDLIKRRPMAVWAVGQIHPSIQWQVSRSVFFPGNFCATVRANKSNLKSWQLSHKPYLACALIGGWTLERSFLFKELAESGLLPEILANYQPRPNQWVPPEFGHLFVAYQSPALAELDDARFRTRAYQQGGINTMTPIDYQTMDQTWISQIIPWQVFDNCWLNLVCETSMDSFLPSEKIGKPLLAGQPWIVFACQHFLRCLREIGFQTFDPWIDESYDSIADHRERAQAVIASLQKFRTLPDHEKISRCQSMSAVLHHNRRLILDTKHWYNPVLAAIKQLIGDVRQK